MSPIRPLLATAALSALLLASPARANDWSNAIDVCQGALPSFDADLRKRPLGIINEGASTAVVNWFGFETTAERFRLPNLSCGLPQDVEINIVQMNTEVSEA